MVWRTLTAAALALAAAAAGAGEAALAHNGVVHKSPEEAAAHLAEERAKLESERSKRAAATAPGLPVTPDALFPAGIGGSYALIDQHERPRTEKDPDGRPQLLFFGYASCEQICSVALPSVAEATRLLEGQGILATPVLITVDPARDTPEAMRTALPKLHPRYVGLTGAPAALRAAEKAFQVQSREVAKTPEGAPMFAHGSFIYLISGDGAFLTMMPPILTPERIAEIVAGYVAAGAAG